MTNTKDYIISVIRENRISTTEIADVMGKTGDVPNVHPLTSSLFCAGEVAFVYALNNSNWEVHKQIQDMDLRDKIVFVHCINCDRAIFGDLVSKYILLYKKARAIVIDGKMRDAHRLIKEKYPIWCTGVTPIGCFNTPNEHDLTLEELAAFKKQFDGSIMVCDDSGVVLIPPEKVDVDLIEKLKFIETQEDIWYFCMDTLKMSTYQIVCEKQYLNQSAQLPEELRKSIFDLYE